MRTALLSDRDRATTLRRAQRLAVEERLARWCPQRPTEKQLDALLADDFELLYGGAMGGGKSSWILMDALMWVHVTGYQALVLRRSITEADRMGGILARAKSWWLGRAGVEFEAKSQTFTFSGAGKITFGYLGEEGDETRFNGTEAQRVYFDELQDFTWQQYSYLFQRVRGTTEIEAPWSVRAGAMPGGVGEEWVNERFCCDESLRAKPPAPDAVKPWIPANDNARPAFVPALSTDNTHISDEYRTKSLSNLDAFTMETRGRGRWGLSAAGIMFKREWFPIVERLPDLHTMAVRFHDFGGGEKKKGKASPDPTASVKMYACGSIVYIADCTEGMLTPNDAQEQMKLLAQADGVACAVRWEEELGASGPQLSASIKRYVVPEYNAEGVRVNGDKVTRSKPLSRAASTRRVYLVRGAWNEMFIARMCGFPIGRKDVTDAASGAYAYLEEAGTGAAVVHDEGDERRTQTSRIRNMMGLGLRVRSIR